MSYHAQDPSWDTASDARPLNLIGYPGAYLADIFLQMFGAAAFLFPLLVFLLSWKWIRSEALEAGGIKDRRLGAADAQRLRAASPSSRCASSAAPSRSAARSASRWRDTW